jgi:hypothetical protein
MPYPDAHAAAMAARAVLATAYDALAELDTHDRAMSWALTEARTAIENATAAINAAEPDSE